VPHYFSDETYARRKGATDGVVLLLLPSHCTQQMQPLDVAFFKPLNRYTDCDITTTLREKPGTTWTIIKDRTHCIIGGYGILKGSDHTNCN
jgi:hypothetical protein